MNLTAENIEKKITDKTKVILLVHVWGTPCDMDPIMAMAKKHNLKVVEDASHAHGALYKGKKVGTFGDVGCFSMQGSKTLPAGEGGILVTDSRECYERACTLGSYERIRNFPDDSPYKKYSLTGFGYKHRIHPIAAAIAEGNLGRLDEMNRIRNRNAHYFEELISDIDFIKAQTVPEGAERVFSYHYMRYIPEKFGNIKIVTLLSALSAEGIVCGSCGYGRLHKSPLITGEGPYGHGCPTACPIYGRKPEPAQLPNTELLAANAFLAAPRFEIECDEYIKLYSEIYHKIADNMDRLAEYEEKNIKASKIENNGTSVNYFDNGKGIKK
jgi:dTDP-4-amino-4,6-dideoxygalactose transaminase